MLYQGIEIYSEVITEENKEQNIPEERKEYFAPVMFVIDDVKRIAQYMYTDRFKNIEDKMYIFFYSEDQPIIIAEKYEVFQKLWTNQRLNKKTHVAESFKNLNLLNQNKEENESQKPNTERCD